MRIKARSATGVAPRSPSFVRQEDAAKKDLDKLQGEWVMQSSERDSKKMSPEQVKGFRGTIKGNAYSVSN